MSPKVSARDLQELFQLAWKVVDSCRQACGEREPLTKEVTSLLGVVSQLQREAEKPNSSLRRQDGVSRDELKSTIRGCRKLLRALDQFLAKYALSHRKGSIRKGLFLKFGNGDVLSMGDVLEELSVHKAALLLNLRLLTPSSRGSVGWSLGKKFPGMQQSVHWTMAKINSSHDGSSQSSSYSEDEKTVWKEIQKGLVKDGWPRHDVKKHRKAIKEYIKNLSWSDAFDETPPSSNPSLHREPQGAFPREVYTPESFPRESFSRDSLPQENFPPPPPQNFQPQNFPPPPPPNFPPQDFPQQSFPPPPPPNFPPQGFPQENFPPPPPPNFTPQSFPQQQYERPIFPQHNYERPIFPPQPYVRCIFPQQNFSEQENFSEQDDFPEQQNFSEQQNFPEQDFPQQDFNPPPPPTFPPQDFPQQNFPPPPPPNFPPQHFTQPDLVHEEAPQQIYVIRSAPQEIHQPESVIYEPPQPTPSPQYIPPSVSDDCQQFDEKSECPLPQQTESRFSVRPCDLSDTFLQCTEKDTWNDMMESLVTTLIDPSKNV